MFISTCAHACKSSRTPQRRHVMERTCDHVQTCMLEHSPGLGYLMCASTPPVRRRNASRRTWSSDARQWWRLGRCTLWWVGVGWCGACADLSDHFGTWSCRSFVGCESSHTFKFSQGAFWTAIHLSCSGLEFPVLYTGNDAIPVEGASRCAGDLI